MTRDEAEEEKALGVLGRLLGSEWEDNRLALARGALELEGFDAEDASAVQQVADALGAQVEALLPELRAEAEAARASARALTMMPFDAVLVRTLRTIGAWGAQAATFYEDEAEERFCRSLEARNPAPHEWKLWRWEEGGAPEAVFVLVRALCHEVLNPRFGEATQQVEEEPSSSDVPALSTAVIHALVSSLWAARPELDYHEGTWSLRDETGAVVASMEGAADTDWAGRLRVTRGVSGQRLVRWLVGEAYRLRAEGGRDFQRVVVRGGLTALARALGISSDKLTGQLREALDVLQQVRVRLPHGEWTPLLRYRLVPEAAGRPAELRITLSDALLPGYVAALPKGSRSQREAKQLVPLPAPLPRGVGHPSSHAAQAVLEVLVLRELRERATELARSGDVHLPPARWQQLAREAGLPPAMLAPVLAAWLKASPEAPALLRESAPERYGLVDARLQALLLEAGQREENGRAAARRRRDWAHPGQGRRRR